MKEIIPMGRRSTHILKIKIFLHSFLRYRKDIANFSAYFGHDRPNPSKRIVSTWCLSAPKINFIPHFFLEILQGFCKLVILSTLSITLPFNLFWRYCKDLILQNINNNMIFHSRLFYRKTNDIIFQKLQNIPFLAHFHNFPLKIGCFYIPSMKKQATLVSDRRTDEQTWIYRTLPTKPEDPINVSEFLAPDYEKSICHFIVGR